MSDARFEATDVETALAQAAETLGVSPDELEHEIVEQKADFWGSDDDTVVIKAWLTDKQTEPETAPEQAAAGDTAAAPEESAAEAMPEPAADDAPAVAAPVTASGGGFWDDEDDAAATAEVSETTREGLAESIEAANEAPPSDIEAAAEPPPAAAAKRDPAPVAGVTVPAGEDVDPRTIVALLQQIFHDMDFDCQAEIEAQEDGFLASVSGADKDLLLEGNGGCLSALKLILNNTFRHKLPSGHKVRVDAGDFRSRRDDELADLAYQVAHSAKEAGTTQETQPLNPYERRLVHLALAEDPDVTTRSRGSGFLKNVQIVPRGGNGRTG